MRKKKKPAGVILSRKQVGLLGGCIVFIAVLAFLSGYVSGTMYQRQFATRSEKKESAHEKYFRGATTHLDADTVQKETSGAPPRETFTFLDTLKKETAPAVEPLPTAGASPAGAPDAKKRGTQKHKKQVRSSPAAAKSKPRKTVKRPVVTAAKAPAQKGLAIQVGSFKSKKDAQRLADKLKSSGYNAFVMAFAYKGQTWHRVRVGVFATVAAAKKVAAKLERAHKLPTLLVTHKP